MAQEENKKKNKLGHMISAIIIAIAAWAVVTYTTDPDIAKTISGVKVEITGSETLKENGFVVTNEGELPKVSVKVSGKRTDLIKALDNIKVEIDVSEITAEGEYAVEGTVKLPSSKLTVKKVSETAIPIMVDKYESKEIPVKIGQYGGQEGKLVKSEPDPKTVTVYGAKRELEYAEYASVELDISGIDEENEITVPYTVVLSEGIDPGEVNIYNSDDETVKIKNTVYAAVEVPVKVVSQNAVAYMLVEEETEVSPQSITIGIKDGRAPDYVSVTLEESAEEGEYAISAADGIYIPNKYKTVKVKPVWRTLNQ